MLLYFFNEFLFFLFVYDIRFYIQLEQSLRAQGIDISSDTNSDEPERRILVQQNIDLRRKIEEEHQNYKRKLSNYQEGQQKQAQLVQKLQQKVDQ